MGRLIFGFLMLLVPLSALADGPNCTGTESYPASMAFTFLKNAGVVDNSKVDFSKTKVIRLASEQIGKDLYRQVHYIVFFYKSGSNVSVITVNDASMEECSMSEVQVYEIKERLDGRHGSHA